MKLLTYLNENSKEEIAILHEDCLLPLPLFPHEYPNSWLEILQKGNLLGKLSLDYQDFIEKTDWTKVSNSLLKLEEVELLAPIPKPPSFRDAYAFRQHVETSRRNRGLDMIPEFDQFPVFYFSNHQSIQGPGDVYVQDQHLDGLDYELEIAIIIGKEGQNIKAEEADSYIAGFMILNDLSARGLQMQEMKLNLGPAKGKDFATAMGPIWVTPDELENYKTKPLEGHVGNAYSLTMEAFINGEKYSEGNLSSMNWTFAEIIERVSYGVTLYPGDIIGSGTVGTGCLLEINGTLSLKNPSYSPVWLKPGDEIECRIEALGSLKNKIVLKD